MPDYDAEKGRSQLIKLSSALRRLHQKLRRPSNGGGSIARQAQVHAGHGKFLVPNCQQKVANKESKLVEVSIEDLKDHFS